MFSEYMYRSKNYGTFCSWPFTTHFLNVWFLKKIGSNKIDKKGAYSVTACTYMYIHRGTGHWPFIWTRNNQHVKHKIMDPHHKLIFILYDKTDLT